MAIGPKQAEQLTPEEVETIQRWERALDLAIALTYKPIDGRAAFYDDEAGVDLPKDYLPEDGKVWTELVRRYTTGDDPWALVHRLTNQTATLYVFSK